MENRALPMSDADWKKLIEENFAGWSTRDPEKVRYMYDPSPVACFVDVGHFQQGFDEYARQAAQRMKQFSSFEIKLENLLSVVQFQGGSMVTTVDLCVVNLQMQGSPDKKPFKAFHTVVWRNHQDGRWLIVHEHQSQVPS